MNSNAVFKMATKRCVVILFSLAVLLNLSPLGAAEPRGITVTTTDGHYRANLGNYFALIIGINAYQEWAPLRTAVKDAVELKKILVERYRFKKENVVLCTDTQATRRVLIRKLRHLAASLQDHDNLLIYFAGHGQLDELTGDGYWIPIEGSLKDASTWVSHSTLKNILSSENVRAKNIVLIADSCYSGTLLRGGPSLLSLSEKGYTDKLIKLNARRSRQVITSGGTEPVADGGRDGHSLFAYYFLRALQENQRDLIDLENLFHTRVWKPVTEIGGQRPNVGRLKTPMDEDGQFVLVLDAKQRTAARVEMEDKLASEKKQLAEEWERIERERQALEQWRALIEERQKIEAERQKLARMKEALEKQKSTTKLAYAPSDADKAVKPASGYRLAIFPWKFTGQSGYISKEMFIRGLNGAIGESSAIELKYMDAGYTEEIDRGVAVLGQYISKADLDGIWHKKSAFSPPEPELDHVGRCGQKLNVDLIMMPYVSGDRYSWGVTIYLIDLETMRVYHKKGRISYNNPDLHTQRLTAGILDAFLLGRNITE